MVSGNKSNWVLYSDGSSNKFRGGACIILKGPEGIGLEHSLCYDFQTTINQAKCKALITKLKLAKPMGVKALIAKSDSQLVIS